MTVQCITDPHSGAAIFITFGLKQCEGRNEIIEDFCDRFPSIANSLRLRYPESPLSAVFGIGSNAWDELFPEAPKPRELVAFEAIDGPKRKAVATPGDLLFHLKSERMDVCFEAARLIQELLRDMTYPIDETHGFRYFDGRAIIGFVDGTENPMDTEVALDGYVGPEDPVFTGGSYVFTQKYIHDMDLWNAMTTEEQERAIGRRKMDDLELEDEAKDPNAHTIVSKAYRENGDEAKIVRANMPFAEPSNNLFGTYFIGYAASFATTQTMLVNMFEGTPQGNYDRLLDFSDPVSGNLYFAPSADLLDSIASGDFRAPIKESNEDITQNTRNVITEEESRGIRNQERKR